MQFILDFNKNERNMTIQRKEDVEKLIENIIIEKFSHLNGDIQAKLQSLGTHEKRIQMVHLLDNDRELFKKILNLFWETKVSKGDQIKHLVKMLRDYVKVSDVEKKKYGEVMTPISLVEDMLDTLPKEVWSNPDLKWLDPANGVGIFPAVIVERLMKGLKRAIPNEEKRYKHIIEEMIYVGEMQANNVFLYMSAFDPKDEYELNIHFGDSLNDSFDEQMEIWGVEKFDIVIGNPPYNQSIDLKFLEKYYNISDRLLFVHPSTWLIDEKNIQSKFINIKNLIGNNLKSVRLFNGNGVFGISLFVPCVITYIDKNHNGNISLIDEINNKKVNYSNISDVNKYNTEEYLSIKNKLLSNDNRISNSYQKGKYWVNLAQIRGDVKFRDRIGFPMNTKLVNDNFYTLCTKKITVETSPRKENALNQFSFNTEIEAINFLNFIKTKFVRFTLSIYKNNGNCHRGEISLIPNLDFIQEWTDEKLKSRFNITDKEWEFIDSVIPNYY